jgi:hypothetical protein
MVDWVRACRSIVNIGREDKALQRCTLSARSMPEMDRSIGYRLCSCLPIHLLAAKSDKPPDLGRSPKPGPKQELPPRGRTYVHIGCPFPPL